MTTAENSPPNLDYSFLSALETPITRPKTSFFYRLGLLFAAAVMILLPLLYLAFIGLTAYGVYYHATHNFPSFDVTGSSRVYRRGRGTVILVILYLAILVGGASVLFFMFKPLFARRPKQAQPLALNPAAEPLLYAFIQKICEAVGAPSPKRIDLNCELNAAAGFRRGFLSFLGNDLVLVIGLPLVANFNTREFAGVVAHEFGHFTQGGAMRLSYVIRRINYWFERVVYERDAWDVALQTWAMEVEDGWAGMIIWTAQLGVFCSRLLLRILMFIGHAIGGFMLRQMEYNADAYEIKVAGSEIFEVTQRKLATLTAAFSETIKHLNASWKTYRTLPDNLPETVRQHHNRLPAHILQKINDTLGLERTGVFDSHPCPADRIRQARKASDPGIFHDERPASSLFVSFDHPSRFVTLLHYTEDLDVPVTQPMLTPVAVERPSAAVVTTTTSAHEVSPESYFFGLMPLLQPLRLNVPIASSNWDGDATELNQLSTGLGQVGEQLGAVRRDFDEATTRLRHAQAAACLLSSGARVDPARFGKQEGSVASAASAEKEAAAVRQRLRESLHEVVPALMRRFELGLSLALANAGEPPALDVDATIAALNQDAELLPRHENLAGAFAVLEEIDALAIAWEASPAVARARTKQIQTIFTLHAALNSTPEPATTEQKPGLRIQGSTQIAGPASGGDLNEIKRQLYEWLAANDKRLNDLIAMAASVETVAS